MLNPLILHDLARIIHQECRTAANALADWPGRHPGPQPPSPIPLESPTSETPGEHEEQRQRPDAA